MGAAGGVSVGTRELLVLTSILRCVPLQQPSLPLPYLSQALCFFMDLLSHISLFFLYCSHRLPPHPSILGTPGMPGHHE